MDSLGRLSDTLPSRGGVNAEKELQTAFRQSALALTGLFKVGKKATTRAYISGKKEALQDVLEFLQASLDSTPGTSTSASAQTTSITGELGSHGQLNVARLIDYICARQETLQAEEDGLQDDDDLTPATAPTASTSTAPAGSTSKASVSSSTSSATPSTSSLFVGRNSTRPQSAPPQRPTPSIPSSPVITQHHPSSSTSSTPHFRNHPTQFDHPNHHDNNPPLTASSTSLPSSPLASGSTTPTTSTSRRRINRRTEKDSTSSSTTSSISSSAATGTTTDQANPSSMKRRFHSVTTTTMNDLDSSVPNTTAVVLNQNNTSSGGVNARGSAGVGEDDDNEVLVEDIEMEMMDGWDGIGERPQKRFLRSR